MIEGTVHEPNLAVNAILAIRGLPESRNVRIAPDMVPWITTDSVRGDRNFTSQSVDAVARQAVPTRWEPPDGSISLSLVDLDQVGKITGTQAVEGASSVSEEKRGAGRPHESDDRVSNESLLLLEQWRATASKGDTNAQFNLGCAYLVGWGVGRDTTTAASWFEAAAEGGDARAQFNLGVILAAGDGVQRDPRRAFRWFKAAADQGDLEAQFNVGRMYANGDGVENYVDEAIRWYRRAATNGHPEAQFNLGVILTPGLGKKPNVREAIRSYEQAFANDIAEAAFNIAVIYRKRAEVSRDFEKAVTWYTKAARKGLAIAQYHLAMCFTNGTGVSKDRKAAFDWFGAAADQGDAVSQYNLAVSYDRGFGVNRDADRAVYWHQQAAKQGFPDSQFRLGIKYATGEGIEKSMLNAYAWIRYASELGHADSQCQLASMYYHGHGVFVDYLEAYKWITLGMSNSANSIDQCVQLRDKIAEELDESKLKRSEQSVIDWSPKSWEQLKPSGYSIKPNGANGEPPYRIIGPIKFVNKLLSMWEISHEYAASLLGFDKQYGEYVDELLHGYEYLVEGSEAEDRIAYLFYIWSVLSELFRDRTVEIKWLRSRERELDGKVPMELILSGSITDLLLVKEFVDFVSGRSGVGEHLPKQPKQGRSVLTR